MSGGFQSRAMPAYKDDEAADAKSRAQFFERAIKFLIIPITGTIAIVKAARSGMPQSKKVKTYVINGILMAVWIAVMVTVLVINVKA